MNIQAMMKQAQKLQKDMMNAKEEIDNMEFESKSSFIFFAICYSQSRTTLTLTITCTKRNFTIMFI